ncbi:hypothetical protein [Streptomyces nojiriensis]|uniref:hypothetical protein n=1 Tax=Streptomyces nojiriensis TaxID=66374 RepID=UPI0035DD79EA
MDVGDLVRIRHEDRLSPLNALLRTPAEQLQAIAAVDDRFDHPEFHERYEDDRLDELASVLARSTTQWGAAGNGGEA